MPTFDRSYDQMECPNPQCHATIALPHQSPLKMFHGQPGPTTDEQKATFLCTTCGRQFECSPEAIHPHHINMSIQDHLTPALWCLEFECVHENCGPQKPIFFAYDASVHPDAVEARVREKLLEVSCSKGHVQTPNWQTVKMNQVLRQKDWLP